jgi:hypothetical protein
LKRDQSRRAPGRGSIVILLALLAALLGGCAAGTAWDYIDEPGVPVSARLSDGSTFSARLVALDDGALVVDRPIPKSERVEVVRRDGEELVLVDGAPIGGARATRAFDVVARQRIPFIEFDDLRVATRTYIGWGSLLAAGLAYMVVTFVEEL